MTLAPDGRTAFVVTRAGLRSPRARYPTFDGWALLDLETGSVIRTGRLPETGWLFDDFSPDGVRVAVSFDSRSGLDRRHAHRATRGRPYADEPRPILWLGWSPDGSRILTDDSAGTLELWDASTGTVQDTVTVPGAATAAWASSARARRT